MTIPTRILAVEFTFTEPMIENPELTLKILRFFAQPDVPFPANFFAQDVFDKFPDEAQDEITYHVRCAKRAGLLEADMAEQTGISGMMLQIGCVYGLTHEGGEYVRCAANHLEAAVKKLKEAGEEVTTGALVTVVKALMLASIGLG